MESLSGSAAPAVGRGLLDERLEARPASARIIALANQKGGVGKTTTAINLGAALAELGRRILLVDFDPQGGCAIGLGIEPGMLGASVYDVLLDRDARVEDVIHKTSVPDLELLPSNIDLAAAELLLVQEVAREQTLLRVLAPLRPNYDFILIDCPPSLGLLTVNAVVAADYALVTTAAQYFSLQGVEQVLEVIELAKENLHPHLEWLGVVMNIADMRLVHSREALNQLRERFGERVFDSVIRASIRYAESAERGLSILDYRPELGADYLALADELLARLGFEAERERLGELRAELVPA